MARFRKNPVEVEAWRFVDLTHIDDMPTWLAGHAQDRNGSESLFIRTLEGVMEAVPGDWIIRGVKGEVYPCKPDIFAATYEEA